MHVVRWWRKRLVDRSPGLVVGNTIEGRGARRRETGTPSLESAQEDFAVFFSEDKSVKLGFSVLCTRPPLPIKNVRKVLTG